MSESQFPRSQFSHFTEEEYDKWVKAGKPFEQHDELLYLDQKLENGSLKRPTEQRNGTSSHSSVGKAGRNAEEKRQSNLSHNKNLNHRL
ncbi:unnamed protein product [Rhizophagus irregularis]|nr:unnamed protein product [Rhizophagus irregularis]CAB5189220.1 unnamed protein product [Rhizophagus irregularis]